MKQGLFLSQVIQGFLLAQEARRLSPNTIRDYTNTLSRFMAHLGDRPFDAIGAEDVRTFLAGLTRPQARGGAARQAPKPLANKTILNYHIGLSALWTWAVAEGIAEEHLLRQVEAPRANKPAIVPLSQQDVRALLGAVDRTRMFGRRGRRVADRARVTAGRDRAIILLLLDTGMRASELCGLRIADVDLRNRRALVHGKGNKDRSLPFSAGTGKALWYYVSRERAGAMTGEHLFATDDGSVLSRQALLTLLKRIGERAGVPDCHPHRFRHTFAIEFLRNGGNAYELQRMLGHETLEMVGRYLALADTDVEAAHRQASPVANWGY